MNADAFRHLYEYHFAANRKLWTDCVLPLSDEQFTQKVTYSVGSVQDHVVHMMSVDDGWFTDLRGEAEPQDSFMDQDDRRDDFRARWDAIEATMRNYLTALTDEMLFQQPILADDDPMTVWQILIHVVNHGTDHRAQLLQLLHSLGGPTFAQDYVWFIQDDL